MMETPRLTKPSDAWRTRLGAAHHAHQWAMLAQDGVEVPIAIEWDRTRLSCRADGCSSSATEAPPPSSSSP
jgi:hypothetical protein